MLEWDRQSQDRDSGSMAQTDARQSFETIAENSATVTQVGHSRPDICKPCAVQTDDKPESPLLGYPVRQGAATASLVSFWNSTQRGRDRACPFAACSDGRR